MSGLEFNKIIASIIIAIIVFIFIGLISNFLINLENIENQETAYKIEMPEITNDAATNSNLESSIEIISPLLASASLKNGEKVFKKCGTCHTYKKDEKSKVGPNLWNIINQPKGDVSGYAYSNALVSHGGQWTYEELNYFLYKPKNYIKGTKMNFAGIKKAQDRADLILWLRENSDDPATLP